MARIALIGLGEIGNVHLRVLEEIPGTDVVATYDVEDRDVTFRETTPQRLQSIDDLETLSVDAVIIGTSTESHFAVLEHVLRVTETTVLVEKPMVATLDELDRIKSLAGIERVNTLFHMAMAAEVEWALTRYAQWVATHGVPVAFESIFTDPFSTDPDATRAKTNSWLDSAINAMSVLERFVTLATVERSATPGLTEGYQARVRANFKTSEVTGHISTSWDVTDKSKHTRFHFADGSALVLDHHAVSAHFIHDNVIVDSFTTDRSVRRIVSHYRNLFSLLFVENEPLFPFEQSERMHRLLLEQL